MYWGTDGSYQYVLFEYIPFYTTDDFPLLQSKGILLSLLFLKYRPFRKNLNKTPKMYYFVSIFDP